MGSGPPRPGPSRRISAVRAGGASGSEVSQNFQKFDNFFFPPTSFPSLKVSDTTYNEISSVKLTIEIFYFKS